MYRYMVETWVFQEKKNYRILTYVSAFDDYTFYHQIKILIGFGIGGNWISNLLFDNKKHGLAFIEDDRLFGFDYF